MHSVKVGWVGQTFALAKRNESDGRKSRIRRSKEERKAMVETFIKKYQESNNGNFPSLNLTHKEVGGSFYTVREIVRDIIQENRVLGPAKFSLQELTSDHFYDHNPLGSIATEPQSVLAASSSKNHLEESKSMGTTGNGYHTRAEHREVENGHLVNVSQVDIINEETVEATVVSDGYYGGFEHQEVDKNHITEDSQVDETDNAIGESTAVSGEPYDGAENQIVDKGQVINGSQVDVTKKEFNEASIPEVHVNESNKQTEKELATASTPKAKVNPVTEDLIVETFPLRPVASTKDGIDVLGELRDSSSSPENDIEVLELKEHQEGSEVNGIEPPKMTSSVDERIEDGVKNHILTNTGQDEVKKLGGTLVESTEQSTHQETFSRESEACTEPQVQVSHDNPTFEASNQNQQVDGAKSSIQDDCQAKTVTSTCTEKSKLSEEGLQKVNKLKVDGKISGNSQIRSNATLDRINLESWDGTPKNSAKKETNPLVAFFKAIVDAVVKLLTE